jgi:hypothetical protein
MEHIMQTTVHIATTTGACEGAKHNRTFTKTNLCRYTSTGDDSSDDKISPESIG